jgi:hypothetical protein
VPAELDPIKWEALDPDQRVDRRIIQQSWLEDDFEIGDQIQSGDYAGMYVGEIIVVGGKYPNVKGGLRPAFNNGGTQSDAIRNITGRATVHRLGANAGQNMEGALYFGRLDSYKASTINNNNAEGVNVNISAHLYVPTAADNRVNTIAERIWHRVA